MAPMDLPAPSLSLLSGASLFLDFDGTLTEIAPSPDGVQIAPQLPDLLRHLYAALTGRLAIVTGRSVASLREMLGDVAIPIVGSHGVEFALDHKKQMTVDRPVGLDTILSELRDFAMKHPGVIVEDKPFGVGLHYRAAPELVDICRIAAQRLVEGTKLELLEGKMVFEIRLGGCDKRTAVRRLMETPPFYGTVPVFMGDDVTDEHGFSAINDLGGHAIIVGDRRPTVASFALANVDAVLDWLMRASDFSVERTFS